MRAVDTNILARLMVNDDPIQVAAAQQAMAMGPVFVAKTVIVELEWVLRSLYGYKRDAIASTLESLITASDVEVEDTASVTQAVDWFRQGMDLADALHLTSSSHTEAFLTFDVAMRRLASRLGLKPPVLAP